MKAGFIFIFSLMTVGAIGQEATLEWFYFHPLKKSWEELGTKGSVQEALIQSGEMPDPFYGTNENKFGWIEDHVWEFKALFFPEKAYQNLEFVELEFPSIDTYAKVYLNDSLILETANGYIPHRVFIQDALKEGLNEFHVFITPPVVYHKDTYTKMGYKLPAPNDVHEVAIAPLTRKPQYQFGWDWALRMNTIGFNKPVKIHYYRDNRIINKTVRTISVDEGKATMEMEVHFARPVNDSVSWHSNEYGEEWVDVKDGVAIRRFEIPNPELWWPRGQGKQTLYGDTWSFGSKNNLHIDKIRLHFGVRTVDLVQEKDEWGTSYYFKINGRRIFCKGADYIPQDIFPARVEDEEIAKMVEMMHESNFNMVRVWGGGYYPDDIFYEKCDELGIMVWQDLMFACSMYPGDDKFIANVSEEFHYQVPRIAGHPSVVQFNGNNEVEVAWGNWGFQIKYGLFGKSAKEIEAAYDRLFKKVAPEIVEQYATVPYIHTSPLSNWGKKEFYNHGSQHYWGVWHGKDPIEDFGKKIGRFNAEYGFQSFPEYNTINMFSTKDDWDLQSEVMKHHQKSYVGNNMILKHAKKLYGEPKNFEEFIYFSQLTQSTAVSMAVAGHRIDATRCGGTLYWQLNDCWPAPSWSSIDYYGNWKALQYQMQKDYKDVAVVAKYNSLEDIDYYVVSDLPDTFECRIKCDVYDLFGRLKTTLHLSQNLNGSESRKLCLKGFEEGFEKSNAHLVFTFYDQNGEEHVATYDHLRIPYEKATESDVKLSMQVDRGGKKATITITNKRFMKNVWLYCDKFGVSFDRNFESLLPGEHVIEIEFDELPQIEDFHLKWL